MKAEAAVLVAAILLCCCASVVVVQGFGAVVIPRTTTKTTRSSHASSTVTRAATANAEFALLFDCDGVILETEELHRLAYNEAFRKFDLTINGERVIWTVRARIRVSLRSSVCQ